MGQTPRELEPTKSPLHYFGAEVRRLRQQLGLSQADLGKLLYQHKDLVRKIEGGSRRPSREFVEQCDEVLGAGGTLRRMWPLLARQRLLLYPATVSGRAAFVSEAIDRPVLDWLLASSKDAKRIRANEDTASLAAEKLRQLRASDHAYGAGEIYPQVADCLGHELETLVDQAPQIATGFLELAGYEAVDLGYDGLAQQHYLHALEIATSSCDHLYSGYLIAVSLAHLALHCGDPDQTIRLATAALRGTEHHATPAVRAAFRAVLARAHARRGDEGACAAALLRAEADMSRSKAADEPAWIAYFGEADLADEKAHCFFDLGLQGLAQREVSRAIDLLEPSRVRRLAIDVALHASSLARCGEIEQACFIGRQAVDHAASTTSFRSSHRIALMMAELQPYADMPVVRDLAEYARSALPPPPEITDREGGRAR